MNNTTPTTPALSVGSLAVTHGRLVLVVEEANAYGEVGVVCDLGSTVEPWTTYADRLESAPALAPKPARYAERILRMDPATLYGSARVDLIESQDAIRRIVSSLTA